MTILLNAITTTASAAAATYSQVIKLISPPGAGAQFAKRTFQGILKTTSGSTTCTAQIIVQVSNDPNALSSDPNTAAWMTIGTITLSGTASTTVFLTDGFSSDAPWLYVRGYIAQLGVTGTNATATLILGV